MCVRETTLDCTAVTLLGWREEGKNARGVKFFHQIISHLTAVIPVTVRLLCMHLSVEKKKKKKKAVNLISIIATQGPKKRRDLQIFLGPLRPGVAGSAAQTSRVDVKSPPRRKYYC